MPLNDRARVAITSSPSHGQPHVELAGGEALAGLGGHLHRADDEPHDDAGDGADQQDEREAAEQQRLLHERERRLRVGEVVDEVQLVRA